MRLSLGLPDVYRAEAAAMYWQAFGGKLGRVLGPDRLALRYVARVMRGDRCIVALGRDGLAGLVGFRTDGGSFAGGTVEDLRRVYGLVGAAWRGGLMRHLGSGPETDDVRFLIDGFCVRPDLRGQGIGTALLAAVCAEARARGHSSIGLDVVDTNARARALYERQGFVVSHEAPIGALRHVFGYRAALTMVHIL